MVDLRERQSPTLYTRTGNEPTAGVTMTYFYSAQCLVILKGGLHSGGLEKRQSPTLYTRTGHEATAGVTMTYF